ncbi:MAG: leucine-rich repeat domain-containing protein [Clostridia bacterium]|nr:leucine-rich repeat domain-containing protein [Clostridia bacterium]
MSDIKSFEPLWGTWRILEPIGEGSFGKVYRAERTDFGNRYFSAIKHISIPSSENQKKEAIAYGLADGYDGLSKYFATITESLMQEINLMYEVKGNTNIVSYEDHLTIPKPDGVGCDIFIRMELLTSLNDIIISRSLPESEIIKLGIDMCSALEVCASKNIIHRDIKPANIFVGANGEYKLGDFGIARHLENATTGMSKKGTYAYMSPEIYHGQPANLTADIYSLGLVMHRLLNDNRAPFMPIYPAPISAMDHENAMLKRISGTPIPAPVHASAALSSVILKATQFDIRQRFATPGEFKRALLQVQKGEELDSTLLLPVTAPPDESTAVLDVSAGIEGTKTAILEDEITAKPTATPQSEQTQYAFEADKPTTLKTKPDVKTDRIIPPWLIVVAALLLFIVGTSAFTLICNPASKTYITIGGKSISTDATVIDLSGLGLTDISELKYCTKLKSLNLGSDKTTDEELTNNISDISVLAYLTNLESLTLDGNNISDISPLSGLTKLEYLFLQNNNISDISPLAGLTNLTHLNLNRNNISDISPLEGLTDLTVLYLSGNKISNVSPLEGHTNLIMLSLNENNISDISSLEGLINLIELHLSENKINSIEPIFKLTDLETLFVVDCGLTTEQQSQLKAALPSSSIRYSY